MVSCFEFLSLAQPQLASTKELLHEVLAAFHIFAGKHISIVSNVWPSERHPSRLVFFKNPRTPAAVVAPSHRPSARIKDTMPSPDDLTVTVTSPSSAPIAQPEKQSPDDLFSTFKSTRPSTSTAPCRSSPPSTSTTRKRLSSIARVNASVAHSIRSAHTILDPAAVVKELVENALDAGATRIDVRLRGKAGLDSITVSDNGRGVAHDDFPMLCLPSTTSKLSTFTDLDALSTFGFRGQALSAICAISAATSVTTRTSSDSFATTLSYAPDGKLTHSIRAARPVGTTLQIDRLFHTLPVRRRDAIRNTTRELTRVVAVVQSLAVICVHARIELRVSGDLKVVSSPTSGISPSAPLCLKALRNSARAVLGTRATKELLELREDSVVTVVIPPAVPENMRDAQRVEDDGARPGRAKARYAVTGLVSRATLAADGTGGRARSMHQYMFINRRPVDLPRLNRVLTELYRRATGLNAASPALVVCFSLPAWSCDVNLAPDKRQVLVHDEDALVQGMVKVLEQVWMPTSSAPIPVDSNEKDVQPKVKMTQRVLNFSDFVRPRPKTAPCSTESIEKSTSEMPSSCPEVIEDTHETSDSNTANDSQGTTAQRDDEGVSAEGGDSPNPQESNEPLTANVVDGDMTSTPLEAPLTDKQLPLPDDGMQSPPPIPQQMSATRGSKEEKGAEPVDNGSHSPNVQIATTQAHPTSNPHDSSDALLMLNEITSTPGKQSQPDNEVLTLMDIDEPQQFDVPAPPSPTQSEQSRFFQDVDSVLASGRKSRTEAGVRDGEQADSSLPDDSPAQSQKEAILELRSNRSGGSKGSLAAFVERRSRRVRSLKRPASDMDNLMTTPRKKNEPDLSDGQKPVLSRPKARRESADETVIMAKVVQTTVTDDPRPESRRPAEKTPALNVDWDKICASPSRRRDYRAMGDDDGQVMTEMFSKASLASDNPESSNLKLQEDADKELGRLFKKEWFNKLRVVGQFNRGFILAMLGKDMFIIDQHASDEKYNFEELERTTVISKQRLVRPLRLEFSAEDELLIVDHLDAFKAGGFELEYRSFLRPTQRLVLKAQPVSKHTMFVEDDLQDIVHMLKNNVLPHSEGTVRVLRPPRVRAMFASRACRKSIMIGTALHKSQMRRLLRQLSTIEHPWTCPHGRPTMRHLCTLPDE